MAWWWVRPAPFIIFLWGFAQKSIVPKCHYFPHPQQWDSPQPSLASCGVHLEYTPYPCEAAGHKMETVHYQYVQVCHVDAAPVDGCFPRPAFVAGPMDFGCSFASCCTARHAVATCILLSWQVALVLHILQMSTAQNLFILPSSPPHVANFPTLHGTHWSERLLVWPHA